MIGPLLILLFVNDLPDVLEALTLLFADDVKVVTRLTQKMNLHGSLKAAWDWSNKWAPLQGTPRCAQPFKSSVSSQRSYQRDFLSKWCFQRTTYCPFTVTASALYMTDLPTSLGASAILTASKKVMLPKS